jgi:hypothetical protein
VRTAHWLADQAGGGGRDSHQPPVEAAAEHLLGLAARFGWARQGGGGPVGGVGPFATKSARAAAAAADKGAGAEAAHRASDAVQAVLCQWSYAASDDEPAAAADEAAAAGAASSRCSAAILPRQAGILVPCLRFGGFGGVFGLASTPEPQLYSLA